MECNDMTKREKDESRQESLAWLRANIKPGETLYTVLRHVSRSGMSRRIDVYAMRPDGLLYLSGHAEAVGIGKRHPSGQGLRVDGCGMDMGFAIVYELSHALWPDGFNCIGKGCPSNDHSNGERSRKHRDGGYALRHAWV